MRFDYLQFRKIKKITRSYDQGITLLIAIIVLSAISLISFSLGSLVLRELRLSRQLALSEPAYSSAEAGAEITLFYRIRGLSQNEQICPFTDFGELPSGATYNVCNDLYDDPLYFNTFTDEVKAILLYDPFDETNSAAGYNSISVTATSGTTVNFSVSAYDINAPDDPPAIDGVLVAVDGTTRVLGGLDPGKSYAIFLDPDPLETGGPKTVNGSVTGSPGGGITGIPSESPTIQSTGISDNLRRKIEVILR
ncbi:MAG: hypothetical protein COT91_00490 [Candidatus Doudnabacteria bacterium CG10_big_fil_rev_8_21_14_0_10_41_10]|uniref:Type 4 fimbrial biogenesis protein PilX N-terminal domain-containing protein n=1 Tax=Candidatus Doudnabacteria bacterium CG10_big_fil_rev_8_21_14_0_10_41_10 TaxID=1974551 RepID=A0A2H0VEU6_9BACT|nr:MAG: hypothetical protein COT91_00490 [Candidatus Doudnabacteria bacterium CG10_big_fil_rev_8_21_14_0_10_41_10]